MSGPRTLAYHVVDVFTDRAFAGNPLAVVLDADDLTTEQMQALAGEFNLSETTFPLPPTQPEASYRLRIFTPQAELPFAGHPSVGSAWVLQSTGRLGTGPAVQECGAGLLPIEVTHDGATLSGGAPTVGEPLDPAPFAAAVGLGAADVTGTPVRRCGVGLEFAFLHVADAAVAASQPDLAAVGALGGAGISVFALDDDFSPGGGAVHARVYAVGAGVPEDPATGSAALGLGVHLVASGLLSGDGESSYVVTQGVEMGRPSRLTCRLRAAGGAVVESSVSGQVAAVAEGHIRVP